MQGLISFGNNFIIAYAGIANENKFLLYYVDTNSDTHSVWLSITPDNYEHTFSYANGVLKYDDDSVASGITIKSSSSSTTVGRGVLSIPDFSANNFIGKIRGITFVSANSNTSDFVATPDVNDGEYCFHRVGYVSGYMKSATETVLNAEMEGDVSFSEDLENFPYGSVANH